MTDLNDLYTVAAHDAGAEMQVKGPEGVKLDMFIKFVGVDSEKWGDIQREYKPKQIEDAIAGGKSANRLVAEMLSKAAIGWRGFKNKRKNVPFTEENLFTLFMNAPYIREQADDFIARRINFMKG